MEDLIEKSVDLTAPEHTEAAVLEFESQEFEQKFNEIDGEPWNPSTLQYLNENEYDALLAGFSGILGYPAATFGVLFAKYGTQTFATSHRAIGAWLLGYVLTSSIGAMAGEKLRDFDLESENSFEGEYREIKPDEDVKSVLEKSDEVNYNQVPDDFEEYSNPSPDEAVEDYSAMMSVLEQELGYWINELESTTDEILSEGQRKLLESYSSEDSGELVDIDSMQEVSEQHQKHVNQIEDEIEEREINRYLRFKDVSNQAYNGFFYQLELYQGTEDKFVVEGLTEQDLTEIGTKVSATETIS